MPSSREEGISHISASLRDTGRGGRRRTRLFPPSHPPTRIPRASPGAAPRALRKPGFLMGGRRSLRRVPMRSAVRGPARGTSEYSPGLAFTQPQQFSFLRGGRRRPGTLSDKPSAVWKPTTATASTRARAHAMALRRRTTGRSLAIPTVASDDAGFARQPPSTAIISEASGIRWPSSETGNFNGSAVGAMRLARENGG